AAVGDLSRLRGRRAARSVAEGAATRSAASRATPSSVGRTIPRDRSDRAERDNPAVSALPFTERGTGKGPRTLIRGWVERPLAPAPGSGALTALSSVMAGPDPA